MIKALYIPTDYGVLDDEEEGGFNIAGMTSLPIEEFLSRSDISGLTSIRFTPVNATSKLPIYYGSDYSLVYGGESALGDIAIYLASFTKFVSLANANNVAKASLPIVISCSVYDSGASIHSEVINVDTHADSFSPILHLAVESTQCPMVKALDITETLISRINEKEVSPGKFTTSITLYVYPSRVYLID